MNIFTLSFCYKMLSKRSAAFLAAMAAFMLLRISVSAQTLTLTDANTNITGGSISYGQKDIVLFGFKLTVTGAMDITGINIKSSADASNYFSNGKLYRSSDNTFSSDDALVNASVSWGTTAGISGFSENLNNQAYYYFLTGDYTEASGGAGNIKFSFSSSQDNAVVETRLLFGFIPYPVEHGGTNISGKTFTIPAPPIVVVWTGSIDNNWENSSNWKNGLRPSSNDIVNIGGEAFKGNKKQPIISQKDVVVKSIVFGTAQDNVTLTVNNKTLTVTGDINRQSSSNSTESSTLAGNGSIAADNIIIGGAVTPSSGNTVTLVSSITNLIVKNNITLKSESGSGFLGMFTTSNADFEAAGNVTVKGAVETINSDIFNESKFTLNTGTLNLTAANPFSLSAAGTNTINLSGGAVNYNGTVAQTIITGTGITYGGKIKVNNTAGVSLNSAMTIKNLVIGDETANSVFNEKGFSTISASLTIKKNSKLVYSGAAFSFRTADVIDTGTTVEFSRTGSQTITLGNKTFQNVILSGSGTKTITAPSSNTAFKTGGFLTITSPAAIAYSSRINAIDIDGNFNGTGSINSGSRPVNIAGNWNNTASGTIAGLVTYDGSVNQSVGGMNYADLILENGGIKKVISTASVTGDIEVKANTALDANGKLTLKASAGATANIKQLLNGAEVIGTATVQAYFKGGSRGYLTLSSPVSDTSSAFTFSQLQKSMIVTGKGGPENGFDEGSSLNPYGPTIQLYNEAAAPNKSQYAYLTTISEQIAAGKGFYFYFRGDRTNPSQKVNAPYDTPENVTMEYTGAINQGTVSVPLSYTDHAGAADNGFNMVGNPYPSIIDLNVLLGSQENKSWILKKDNSYAVYDPQLPLDVQINGATRYILPGQGFFIKASQPGAVLTFTEACKVASADISNIPGRIMKEKNKFLMASAGTKTYSSPIRFIKLAVKQDTSLSDETIIALKEGSDSTMTAEDANYMGAGKISISSYSSDDKKLAINYMPAVESEDSEVRLYVTASQSGSYSIEASNITAFEGMDVFLNDLYTRQMVSLKSDQPYTFSIDKNNAETYGKGRFKISFVKPKVLPVSHISFTAKKVSTGAELNWLIASNTDNTRFEIQRSTDGKTFTSIDTISEARMFYSYQDINPVPGVNYYRLKQVGADGKTTYYEPASLSFGMIKQENTLALTVYPNPVVNEFRIALGEKTGPVGIRIYDTSGKTIKHEELASSENIVQNVAGLQTGIYIVEVTGAQTNEMLGKAKFIKQ